MPANKAILQKFVKHNQDVFLPNSDGTHRRVHYPDGKPIVVDIHLEPGARAHSAAYRVPKGSSNRVEKKLFDLKRQGLIEEAPFSQFSSSLLVIAKPDGDIRMTVDYRKLNQFFKQYTYPLTTTEDIFNRMAGGTKFSCIDLSQWSYQFSPGESSRDGTTFVTPTWCLAMEGFTDGLEHISASCSVPHR